MGRTNTASSRPAAFERISYELPVGAIAQRPAERRDESRLLVLDRASGSLEFGVARDLPAFLMPTDLMVLNDSRVVPSKIWVTRPTGKKVELLILDPLGGGERRRTLAQDSGKFRVGEIFAGPGSLTLRFVGREDSGAAIFEGTPSEGWMSYLEREGRMPLPPYIRRAEDDAVLGRLDHERYQCGYAAENGSVAAPTAGLHFSPELLAGVRAKAEIAYLTLHVGEATFRSHEGVPPGTESFLVPAATWTRAQAAKRVLAVGTTVCRTLEHLAALPPHPNPLPQGEREPFSGETGIVISPGFGFGITGALMTNFHMPESSPLALAAAFAGKDLLLRAYEAALREGFRFASYGDGMLIL